MKAKITEKINTKTVQFAWDAQVLYLQITEYENGRKIYSIKEVPEENISYQFKNITVPVTNNFSIPVAIGKLNVDFYSKGIKKQLEENRNVIFNNIEYFKCIQEIFNYIEELEKENNSEFDIEIGEYEAKRWTESGLLEGLDEEQANELSKVFEDLAHYLISLKKDGPVFGFIFPAIRKIYKRIDKPGKFSLIINVIDLFLDLNEKWILFREKNKTEIENKEYISGSSIDVEAEFIYNYCEEYVNDLKKRGII